MMSPTQTIHLTVNGAARDNLARSYAQRFRLATENECPTSLGKPFWFACASEVRRLHPAPQAPAGSPPSPK